MSTRQESPKTERTSRRRFLENSTAMLGATMAAGLPLARAVHAAGDDKFKVGLIGCGGRGSGAAANAMNAGGDVILTAMADVFEDKVKGSRDRLKQQKPDQVAVDDDHCFVGFDGYQKVIESDVDVVIIACTSHFHPMYLKAAVDAGKHVFCEKPHSLDVPGLHSVAATCEEAKKKNLSIVSGLCWRYDHGMRETVKRVHDGMIGDVVAIQETYVVGPYRSIEREPGLSEMEWQMRNWYHFNWLAGDQVLQQLIHSIDKGAWIMHDEPPVKAWGMGGRANCFGTRYGDLFDHQTVVYEYANGVRMFGLCRNHVNCYNQLADTVFGTKGTAHLVKHRIEVGGKTTWRFEGTKPSMTDSEHVALFDSIRNGTPINNAGYMFGSTMLALLGQFVCHTGKEITWDDALNSKASFALDRYDWDVEPPIKPNEKGDYDIAVPGVTKFA
ncbi:MAG: Gfo/Idh/MocA family oxidoreductase [Planctomycetota bacterium]